MSRMAYLPYIRGSNSQLERTHYFLLARGDDGATDAELMEALGIEQRSDAAARRKELVNAGLVEDSGKRRRSHISGKSITVWRAVPGA